MREIKFRVWDKNYEEMVYDFNDFVYFDETGKLSKLDSLETMQFTGLEDKEGNEIYEGDIVKGKIKFRGTVMGVKGQVIYNHCRFVIGEYNCELYQFSNNFDGRGLWIEVIGNKYENPELLEGFDE